MLRTGVLHGEQQVIDPIARQAIAELRGQLRPFIARRLNRAEDVDDVLQDSLLRIQTGLPSLRQTERFGPWVYQVVRNALADHHREQHRRQRERTAFELAQQYQLPQASGPLPDGPPGYTLEGEPPPFEQALAACAADSLALLPPRYKEALTLTEIQGWSQRQAADTQGISLSGMKSRVQRGRRLLREALLHCCEIATDQRGHVLMCLPRVNDPPPAARSTGCRRCTSESSQASRPSPHGSQPTQRV